MVPAGSALRLTYRLPTTKPKQKPCPKAARAGFFRRAEERPARNCREIRLFPENEPSASIRNPVRKKIRISGDLSGNADTIRVCRKGNHKR